MPIGQLEPLYRYLELRDQTDPVEAILTDMETLAQGGYIRNLDGQEGVHEVCRSDAAEKEISTILLALTQVDPVGPNFHVSYQAIGPKMYIAVSRVGTTTSKTCLALCINEDDTVNVIFIEPDAIWFSGLVGSKLYGSISTVIVAADGTQKNGFLRCETTFLNLGDGRLGIKCDFKLSRTRPFHITVYSCHEANPSSKIGNAEKALFEVAEGNAIVTLPLDEEARF